MLLVHPQDVSLLQCENLQEFYLRWAVSQLVGPQTCVYGLAFITCMGANSPVIPMCYSQPNHLEHYTCGVKQYP